MNLLRLISLNVAVFLGLLLVTEMTLRAAWTVRSCWQSSCDFSRIAMDKARVWPDPVNAVSRALRFHDELGYVPNENFDAVLSSQMWENNRLTINADGFRDNGGVIERSTDDILAVGDSFTWGEKVSNEDTWPACLQDRLQRRVDNGGVTGYGGAQSLRRAMVELEKREYTDVVLSVVVGDDFSRDRMSYKWGRPRPAIVDVDGELGWSEVADPELPGTIFNPRVPNPVFVFLYENSMLIAMAVDTLAPQLVFPWAEFEREHPDAATTPQIVAWTLKAFDELPVQRKILLLQYWPILDDESTLKERNLIRQLAEPLSLTVVDTYEPLSRQDAELMWHGHHTPAGNRLVCEQPVQTAYGSG